ncbi:MAG: hypothetical protein ACXVX8_15825 [Blastococcus sp.]
MSVLPVPTIQEMRPSGGRRVEDDVDDDADSASSAEAGWTWPPYAPVEPAEEARFSIDEWAPPSCVRHPWVRVGRWTVLYRRAA